MTMTQMISLSYMVGVVSGLGLALLIIRFAVWRLRKEMSI
jgi:flagellar biogenesis protein FliO